MKLLSSARFRTCSFLPLAAAITTLLVCHWTAVTAGPPHLKMVAPSAYLPDIPVLVRVELRNGNEEIDRDRWDAQALLTTDEPGVTLSTNLVQLRNGLGTARVTVSGTTNFTLTSALDSLSAQRTMTFVDGTAANFVSGNLTGTSVTWSNVVRVEGNVTNVPGQTLTILPGTFVLLNGVPSGNKGTAIEIQGTMQSLGTEDEPVTFTAMTNALPWGDLRHRNAQPSVYRHTFITRGGHSPPDGHVPTSGIVLRLDNSAVTLTDSAIAYNPGKALRATGSDLRLTNCIVAHGAHGGEIDNSALVAEDCWFMEMRGADDNDGLYLWGRQEGQTLLLRGCVLGLVDDDAADNLRSVVTYERCIFRDAYDKGISQIAGTMHIRNCLVANCDIGVSIKGQSSSVTGTVHMDRTTISTRGRGIAVQNKYGIATVFLDYYVTNSIIVAPVSIYTDYNPANIHLFYTDTSSATWPGAGNLSIDPLFVNPSNDFHLQPGSACIDTGDPGTLDPDGSRVDMSVYTFVPPPPWLAAPAFMPESGFQFSLHAMSNRNYLIESASFATNWTRMKTVWQAADPMTVTDEDAVNEPHKIYRARLAP